MDNSELTGFSWSDTVPQLKLHGRTPFEVRVRATVEEKLASKMHPEEELYYWWNTSTNARRWEIAGGNHVRFVTSGDLGSSQFSAICYISKIGGWWLLWPDIQHVIMRREAQTRDGIKNVRAVIARAMITCRVSRGPFKGNKHGRCLLEAHGRMIKARCILSSQTHTRRYAYIPCIKKTT